MTIPTSKPEHRKIFRPFAFAGVAGLFLALATASATAATALNSAVNLTESADHYTATLALPADTDPQMDIRLDDRTLRISSGKSNGGMQVEQSFVLPQADVTKSPQIDRRQDQLVITVPKGPAGSVASVPVPSAAPQNFRPSPPPVVAGVDASDQQVFEQLRRMQQQMNQMMQQAMSGAGGMDPFAALSGGMGAAGDGVNLKDEGGSYVVRAKVPGGSLKDVKVSVDNDRVLKIAAKDESSTGNSYQMSDFTQVFTLPGPVQADKIKVDQADGGLVITLPKA